MLLLLYLISARKQQKVLTNLEEMVSLFSPAVKENGRSPYYNFMGEYVIQTYASDTPYIQLGYSGPSSTATLESKEALPSTNVRIDTRFTLEPSHLPGEGVLFSWGEKHTPGAFYGRESKPRGVSVEIITSGDKPLLRLNVAESSESKPLSSDIYKETCVLRIDNFSNRLKIMLSIGNKDYVKMFEVANSNVTPGGHYSIGCGNTMGYNVFRTYGIKIHSLTTAVEDFVEARKGSKFMWVIFILGVIGLGIYLFLKQVKRPERMI